MNFVSNGVPWSDKVHAPRTAKHALAKLRREFEWFLTSTVVRAAQIYDDLRAASLNLARLYMQSALNEAAALQKEAPGLPPSALSRRTEEVGGYLRESIALAHRVNNFARGLNRECSALLHSVRQKQSSL